MAPACVLLHRNVTFREHPLDLELEQERASAAGVVGGGATATAASSSSKADEDMDAAATEYLWSMMPDPQFVDPPGVSSLTMLRPPSSNPISKYGHHLASGFVAAADKNLVLLYAGFYRPASFDGCYLLFDAASSSLSTIPGIHRDNHTFSYRCAGYGTIIMSHEDGSFFLAELLFRFNRPGAGVPTGGKLYFMSSSSQKDWFIKDGDLPAQVCRTWKVHTSFSVRSRNLFCWVDFLHGLLLCDLRRYLNADSPVDLGMSFVPLPVGCSISEESHLSRNPQDFRTMACVDGTIKFLTIVGFMEASPISLVTYALDLDGPSPSWTQDTVLRLEDLWVDKTFTSMNVPRVRPMFPILSTQEHDVVYLVIARDPEYLDGYKVTRVNFMLSVDTRKARVISADQQNCPRTLLSSRYLLAFNASQWVSAYHQRARCKQVGWGQVENGSGINNRGNRIM